jgi:hypothetical protein
MNEHLIDDVARRMTDVTPPAELRARVAARLGDRPAPWRAWMPLVTAAAIVTAVAGVSVARRAPQLRTTTPLATVSQTLPGNTSTAALVSANNSTVPIKKKRPVKSETISAAEAAWRTRAIPAIAAAQPLTADDIQPQSLSVPLLELKPLVTLPVTVAPIGADASGGR